MSRRFFTSDPHLFHDRVAEMRGFPDGRCWTSHFVKVWMETVGPRDSVFVLGDLALGGRQTTEALAVMSALPGTVDFVLGNHDSPHPMHRSSIQQQQRFLQTFRSVQTDATIRVDGRKVRLSHFPTNRDHTDIPRHMEWRPKMLDGGVLIHGHTHSMEPSVYDEAANLLEINVAPEAWHLRLVTEQEIIDTIREAGLR